MIAGLVGKHFNNWAETHRCQPELYFEPSSLEEISQVLSFAKKNNKKVKVVGKGHSPSDIACTTEYMISLDKMSNVLHVDKKKLQIKVEAGLEVSKLNKTILPSQGLALSILGSVSELSVAGIISTGTHGTGVNFGSIATFVVEMEMMTANGQIIRVSRQENKEIFLAACCGLGCLGIIVTVTLQCEKAFRLHQKQLPCTLEEVLTHLDDYLHSCEHFRFTWYPHTEGVVTFQSNRTQEPLLNSYSWFWDYGVGYHSLQFAYWLGSFMPNLVSSINRFYYNLLFSTPREDIGDSYNIFNFDCLFKQHVTEWAIPRDNVGQAMRELKAWLENHKEVAAHYPVEVRFVKADNIYLSPAHGRESCFINIIMYRPYGKFVEHADYWETFEGIMERADGRPHWAKDHKVTYEKFCKMYPQFGKFCKIRKQLDPEGLFENAYINRVFKSQ